MLQTSCILLNRSWVESRKVATNHGWNDDDDGDVSSKKRFQAKVVSRPVPFAMPYMVGRENKRKNNRTTLLAQKYIINRYLTKMEGQQLRSQQAL